jgi:NADH-quinone oxidoreductase subunit L
MYHAIVFLPLLGFLIAGIFGRVIGARASEIVTTSFLMIAALLSWIAFFSVGFGDGAQTCASRPGWSPAISWSTGPSASIRSPPSC